MSFNVVSAKYDLRRKRALIDLQDEGAEPTIITIESSLIVAPGTSEQDLLLQAEKAAVQALIGAASYLSVTPRGVPDAVDETISRKVAELREVARAARYSLHDEVREGSEQASAA